MVKRDGESSKREKQLKEKDFPEKVIPKND